MNPGRLASKICALNHHYACFQSKDVYDSPCSQLGYYCDGEIRHIHMKHN